MNNYHIEITIKEDCVCWDHMFRTCNAIEPSVFRKFRCACCPFYKTADQYYKQTGITYEHAMRNAKVYGRK